jgi:uncharacterized coiled-coil DUF342 family protein
MSETTTTMNTDLDRLAERVEKAASLVQQLREDRERLARERDELAKGIEELKQQLHGQDATALVQELGALRREQREWIGERRDVAARIESLVKKLERLES